jgi:hypothetical protein
MNIQNFNDLLAAASAQDLPQRLLLVFAGGELLEDATPEQRAAFEAGHGGTLVPLMCVDKTPDELASFESLVDESAQFAKPWVLVFVAALSGLPGQAPSTEDAEKPLQSMVESIRTGDLNGFLVFDKDGLPVQLT